MRYSSDYVETFEYVEDDYTLKVDPALLGRKKSADRSGGFSIAMSVLSILGSIILMICALVYAFSLIGAFSIDNPLKVLLIGGCAFAFSLLTLILAKANIGKALDSELETDNAKGAVVASNFAVTLFLIMMFAFIIIGLIYNWPILMNLIKR